MSETTAAVRTDLLTLVRTQIAANLAQISDAAAQHATAPNNATLTPCVAAAHQVAGVLRMVQLPGAARFASEIETALKTALRGTPADTNETAIAGRAATTLRDFVNAVADGGRYVPLALFPAFRELARVGGNATPSEKDLYFPPLHDDAPVHANSRAITPGVLPALVKDFRSRFQRGLLAWLKESTKPDGPRLMRGVLDQMHQIAVQLPQPRGLWWASTLLMDSVVELQTNPQAADWLARVKPVCSRIDFLLRDLASGGKADTAPAQREVYYAIASCPLPPPALRDARRLLQLENLIPEAPAVKTDTQSQQPLLDDARARLENIKEVWTEYVAGEPNRLARFRELLAPLTQKARELGNLPLTQLLLAITNATAQLPDPYPLDGQVMSLEMASALLMAESIVTHYHDLPPDLEQQVGIMKGWLADAVAGKVSTGSPAGLRADIVQKANDEKLRIATAREILKNLQQVEKVVEAYAQDPFKRNTLPPLSATLRQVQGVFEVSNQKRAARLALACQHLIERCASGSVSNPQRDLEWLAEGLGCLGFYLEPCLHGKEPNERAINLYFTRYEKQQGLEALLALSQHLPVAQPPAAPAPAAAPGVDREMLEIFLEEASEVLSGVETHIAQVRKGAVGANDGDALINVRRGFHTLKGSSRMVGLTAYGEFAWEMEQVMNHWLAQARPATPELLNLIDEARALLSEWAHALQGEAEPPIDTAALVVRARALRDVAPPAAAAATAIPRTQQTVVPTEDANLTMTGRLRTNIALAAQNFAATAPISPTANAAPEVLVNTVRMATVTRVADSSAQTVADLGERLSAMNALAAQIKREALGTSNTRLNEIAGALDLHLQEAHELYRKLAAALPNQS